MFAGRLEKRMSRAKIAVEIPDAKNNAVIADMIVSARSLVR
jgi:hypothetical protein